MTDTTTDPLIALRDVQLRLGQAGDASVNFSLPEFTAQAGEQIALTGPSGCGKSTLLNVLAGLLEPQQGSVSVAGKRMKDLSLGQRDVHRGRSIGFIYQTFNLLEGFTALENVKVGMRFGRSIPSGERNARARTLLDQVGLSHRLHAKPARMSVGERQRVAIARAVANKPAILLADEPTGALDPATGEQVFQLLLDMCAAENCTLLFVTHDRGLAERLPRQLDCRNLLNSEGAA